jgi:ribonuclease HI
MRSTIIHTDGASRGNPGPAAYAFTLAQPGHEVYEESACLGTMTNNQAEYTAFVRALEYAVKAGVRTPIILKSDSELIVKQMRGEYRVKNEELRPLYAQAKKAEATLSAGVTYEHVRREQNKRADELCNIALDGGKPAARNTSRATAPRERNALKADVIALLSEAGALPTPEAVWDQLAALLRRHGLKVPR